MSPIWPNRKPTFGSRTALFLLRLAGWTPILIDSPSLKFVAPAYPHTSNADFWPGLFWTWATRSPVKFLAKRELFKFPIGGFMRAVGGIPVDRKRAGGNFVDEVVSIIDQTPEIILVVAPEGTRSKAAYWKTGFYYMALEAKVPLGIIGLDWKLKRVGVIGYVQPTGDIDADFLAISRILDGIQGRKPENQTPIVPRPKDSPKDNPKDKA